MTLGVQLDVSGRAVLVVGGTPAALGKIGTLLRLGAQVTVASPDVETSIRDLADRGLISWLPRNALAKDFRRASLVIAATGRSHTDAEVRAAAALENRVTLSAGSSLHPLTPAPNSRPAAVDSTPPEATTPLPEPVEGRPERSGDGDPGNDEAILTNGGTGVGTSVGIGRVVLVGGGPGDPGLLTVAGLAAIRTADVIVCDRLAPLAALEQARPDALIIDVGKIPRGEFTPQERINALLIEHARRGRRVVRLKGGDNFIFGRGGEEWQACVAEGVSVEVIPGLSSALAAPALAGIPLTHRQLTQGFTVVSGHLPPGDRGSTLDWAALARTNTTLVIMMGLANLAPIAEELARQGLAPTTPAVTVADAGMPSQRSVHANLDTIARLTREAGIKAPAVTVIGAVAGFNPRTGPPG